MNLQSRTGNWTTVTEEGSWRSFDTGKKLIFLVTQEQLDFLWRKKANWTSCGTGRKLKPVLTTGRKLVVSRKLGTKMTGISQLTCFCARKSAWKLSSSFWEHMRVDKNAWQPFIYLFLFFLLIFFFILQGRTTHFRGMASNLRMTISTQTRAWFQFTIS